jgi:hypothetical protein
VVRTTGAERLPHELGGLRHGHDAGGDGSRGDDLDEGGSAGSWIAQYGVPVALYTDWKTVYVKEATEQQLLRGEAAVTQLGRMCEPLGI